MRFGYFFAAMKIKKHYYIITLISMNSVRHTRIFIAINK